MMHSVHRYPITILESHLDTLGHMNHTTYLVLFEEARWELITQGGYGLKRILESGIGPVILDVKVRYKRELRLRQKAIIETRLISHIRNIGTVLQEMKDEEGMICCVLELKAGVFDLKTRKLVPPPQDWLKAWGLECDSTE